MHVLLTLITTYYRVVAMTCGISGIVLAKKSIDRQRLALLRERNPSRKANINR